MNRSQLADRILDVLMEDGGVQFDQKHIVEAIVTAVDVIDPRSHRNWIAYLETTGRLVPVATDVWQVRPEVRVAITAYAEEEKGESD